MIKPMAHYSRPRNRICLLYKQENLDRNEELQNLYVYLQKKLSLLLPQMHRAWICGMCCLLQCDFSWARRDLYFQATSFPKSIDRL